MLFGSVASAQGHLTHYHAQAVHDDGTASLTNSHMAVAADVRYFPGSLWVKPTQGTLNGACTIFGPRLSGPVSPAGSPWFSLRMTAAGGFIVGIAQNAAPNYSFGVVANNGSLVADTWANIRWDMDIVGQTGHVFVGQNDVTNTTSALGAPVAITINGFAVGFPEKVGAPTLPTADFADVWVGLNQSLDMSMSGVGPKFIDAGTSKPVFLGPDGSIPTGVVPDIFFSGPPSKFITNLGTAGAFALSGAFSAASTSPSD